MTENGGKLVENVKKRELKVYETMGAGAVAGICLLFFFLVFFFFFFFFFFCYFEFFFWQLWFRVFFFSIFRFVKKKKSIFICKLTIFHVLYENMKNKYIIGAASVFGNTPIDVSVFSGNLKRVYMKNVKIYRFYV
jgi:hypothetical protein